MSNGWLVIPSVIFSSVTAPLVLAYLTNRQRREEKREDWKRQDEVAAQAAEAAQLLLDAQAETIRKTDEVAAAHKQDNIRISDKLEVIRVDVNSNMTAAMQAELDATEGQLVLMREVIALKEAQGQQPSGESLALLTAKHDRINELKATLNDRLSHSDPQAGGE